MWYILVCIHCYYILITDRLTLTFPVYTDSCRLTTNTITFPRETQKAGKYTPKQMMNKQKGILRKPRVYSRFRVGDPLIKSYCRICGMVGKILKNG